MSLEDIIAYIFLFIGGIFWFFVEKNGKIEESAPPLPPLEESEGDIDWKEFLEKQKQSRAKERVNRPSKKSEVVKKEIGDSQDHYADRVQHTDTRIGKWVRHLPEKQTLIVSQVILGKPKAFSDYGD